MLPRLLLAAVMSGGLATVGSTAEGKAGRSSASTPLRIIRTVQPLYPEKLADRFLDKGEARIMVMVDKEGRLMDWIVTGYTHALFAKEALDVLQKWKYKPATLHGQPIGVRTELRFIYRNSGGVRIVPGDLEMRLRVKDIRSKEYFWQRTCRLEEPVGIGGVTRRPGVAVAGLEANDAAGGFLALRLLAAPEVGHVGRALRWRRVAVGDRFGGEGCGEILAIDIRLDPGEIGGAVSGGAISAEGVVPARENPGARTGGRDDRRGIGGSGKADSDQQPAASPQPFVTYYVTNFRAGRRDGFVT